MRKHSVLALRALAFLALWLVLMPSLKPGDLAFGALAAGLATWASAFLLPAEHDYLRLHRLVALLPHFLWESVKAGIDVARRAFNPALPLNPGLVRYRADLPGGFACNTFATFTSLMPGSLPCGEEEGALVYHSLDVGQPVAEALAKEERYLAGALVREAPDA